MSKYQCPFCEPRYQFHKKRSDGVMICGQCGDPLVKIPLIKPTQIFALVAASAFIIPLGLMVFDLLKDLKIQHPRQATDSMASIPKSNTEKLNKFI